VLGASLVLSALVAAPGRAHAQSAADLASARALYKEARELRDKGDTRAALEKFKAANALAGTPITALELGRTHAQAGQPVEALEAWLSVARMRVDPKESENAKSARAEAATLAEQIAPKIPSLVVKLEDPPPDVTVTVDGATLPAETLGHPRKLDPGDHTVVARGRGVSDETRAVRLEEGAAETVTIVFPRARALAAPAPSVPAPVPAASAAPAPRPASHEETRARTSPLVYVGFGVGAAGLVVGAIGGGVALAEKGKLGPLCEGLSCDPSAKKIVSSGRTWATVSTVGFVVGGVGVAAGIVGLLMPRREVVVVPGLTARLVLDPGAVGLEGTF